MSKCKYSNIWLPDALVYCVIRNEVDRIFYVPAHHVLNSINSTIQGGECVTSIIADTNGETFEVRKCDCDSTSTGVDIFAGVSCEHKATSFCTIPTKARFCVNGGICQKNNVCDCELPWKGIHCELPVLPKDLPDDYDDSVNDVATNDNSLTECNLKCMNGGTCVQGAKDLGFLHDTIRDVANSNQTHAEDQFAHCACTSGWSGLTCESKIEVCGEDQHFCLHGSKCISDTTVDWGYSCDCSQADFSIGNNNDIHYFAGDSCQYTDSDICTIGNEYSGQPLYFCVNGGSCNAWVLSDEPDPGCTCPDNYIGPHCEVNTAIGKNRSSGLKVENAGVIAGSLVTLLGVLALITSYLGSKLTRKNISVPASKSAPVTETPFSPRRRRRAGFGRSPNRKPSISVNDVPPSCDLDDDPIASGHINERDGIMNDRLGDERSYYGENPVLVENLSLNVGSKLQDSHYV